MSTGDCYCLNFVILCLYNNCCVQINGLNRRLRSDTMDEWNHPFERAEKGKRHWNPPKDNFAFDMELFSREAAELTNRNHIPPGQHTILIDKVTVGEELTVTGSLVSRTARVPRPSQRRDPVLPKPPEPKAGVPQAAYGLGQRRIK